MEKIKNFLIKIQNILKNNIFVCITLIILSSIAVTYLMLSFAPGSFREFWELCKQDYTLLLLNYIPVLILMLIVYFLFNNILLGISLPSVILMLMTFVNRTKVVLRQDPFQPVDLTLVSEAVSILKNFSPIYLVTAAVAVILLILLIFISIKFFRGKKQPIALRISLPLIFIVIGCSLFNTSYKKNLLYESFKVNGNIYNTLNQYESKGFLYSFVHDLTKKAIEKPNGYNLTAYKEIDSDFAPDKNEDKPKPHIIMIMGEAFSDLSESSLIDFDGYTDPLENYKKISSSDNAISGNIIVPSFGGGTANTEFDALTGGLTRYLNSALSSYNYVIKDMPAMPSALKAIGYDTLAIHPSFSWFYNRQNVYNFFGFDKFIAEESFDLPTQNKAGYISEEVTIDAIIDSYEEHIQSSDNPLFSFTVTIQNHGPYDNKYNIQKNFNSNEILTSEEYNLLSNYFGGMIDADVELNRLIEYFSEDEEPVVVVYFGDHLPGFTTGLDLYDKLMPHINIDGTLEEYMNQYRTPFLIWQNDSAKSLVDFQSKKDTLELSDNPTISANYLGALTTELIGLENINPLFSYENHLRKELPVITNGVYMDNDGNYVSEISDDAKEKVEFLRGWVYYQVKDR